GNFVGILFQNSSNNNTLTANNVYANLYGIGFQTGSSTETLSGNNVYSNINWGLYFNNSVGTLFTNGRLGYDATGASAPDSVAEIFLDATTTSNLTLEASQVNPAPGIDVGGFSR